MTVIHTLSPFISLAVFETSIEIVSAFTVHIPPVKTLGRGRPAGVSIHSVRCLHTQKHSESVR